MGSSTFISTGLLFTVAAFSTQLMAAPAPIITSTINQPEFGSDSVGIGITASVAKRPFVGVDDQNTTLPYFSLNFGDLKVEGLDISYDLTHDPDMRLNLLATPRFYERKPSFADNGELDGISSTRETYLVGLSSQFHTDNRALTLQLFYDALESDGIEAVAQYSGVWDLSDSFKFIPSFGVSWQDAELVDHFYGVTQAESISGRAAYEGESSFNYNITFNTLWAVTDRINLLGQIKYERLGSGITNSSIVDEDSVYFITAGAVYRY